MRTALPFLLIMIGFSTFGQKTKPFPADTSRIAIMQPDNHLPSNEIVSLSQEELSLVEELIQKAFADYNETARRNCPLDTLSIQLYKRQYFLSNRNGFKTVYINCFIDNKDEFPLWRKYLVIVFDAGGFVNLEVNLERHEYSEFHLNHPAFRKMRIINAAIRNTCSLR